ncbi:MAG: phospho-sugar mutase [Acidimicrobiales bacterium]|nr:phospho-sugar mutase [Acidimicrobiales bacterium]
MSSTGNDLSAGAKVASVRSDEDLIAAAEAWLARDPDPDTRAELQDLLEAGDRDGIAERFAGLVTFGTAGLRSQMGAGPNRMNRLVVRFAAAGLGDWLGPGATVVIGHDRRWKSDVFADDAARVLAAAGHRVLRFRAAVPTPLLAFAVRDQKADAGVMVTASHNPPTDNGIKIYQGDGVQIGPPLDAEVAACIRARAASGETELADSDDPRIEDVGGDVRARYVEAALALVSAERSDLTIVYTPLHGVGASVTEEVFARAGFAFFTVVKEQREPDPAFPTVTFPNPEEPEALELVKAEAIQRGADLLLAHDPDADRLGVAVPTSHTPAGSRSSAAWRTLTGDEIGVLLAEHLLRPTEGADRLVATTFVSSRLLSRMAAFHGVRYVDTLTGFKWVMRAAFGDPAYRFVFAYEEALGYAVSDAVRDKDGITAALVFADLVASLRQGGHLVLDVLDELARRHGVHATSNRQIRFAQPGGRERIARFMDELRSNPPTRLGDRAVTAVVDLANPGSLPGLPPTDAVALYAEDARVVVRPSGTEPKLKLYVEAVQAVAAGDDLASVRTEAAAVADAIANSMLSTVGPR